MKKLKKIILTILVMSLLVNPMYLTLRVHAANEEVAASRISDTLRSVMKNSPEEKIKVMIWLNDANASAVKLTSTEAILAQAKATLSSRGISTAAATDAEIYSQYMAERKEILRTLHTAHTSEFAYFYLYDNEIIYLSIYSPVVIASLTKSRINEVSKCSNIRSMDFYCDDIEENSDEIQEDIDSKSSTDIGYSMAYLKQYLGINNLISYVGSEEEIKIGVLDEGQPNIQYLRQLGLNDNFEMNDHVWYATENRHPKHVLEIIHSIIPDAYFYYTTYRFVNDNDTHTLIEEIDWLLSKNVDIINCSLHLSSQSPQGVYDSYSTYGNIAEYLDYISNEYDVTIIKSAGNWKQDNNGNYVHYGVSSGAMAYNIITVGNFNLQTYMLDESSQYYQGSVWTNKPDICAPGYIQFLDLFEDNGTSYAASIVAGVAALIISHYDSMILPCKVKSIICASCSQHRYTCDNNNFKKYGAGVIDAYYVRQILAGDQQSAHYMEYEDYEQTYQILFDTPDYSYMDIVLTFDKTFFEDIGLGVANLDLYLYDSEGDIIASSTSTKNNVEVLLNITPRSEYMILKVRQTGTVPNNQTVGTEDLTVLYSLAWRMH